jgi:hypothetical protein
MFSRLHGIQGASQNRVVHQGGGSFPGKSHVYAYKRRGTLVDESVDKAFIPAYYNTYQHQSYSPST